VTLSKLLVTLSKSLVTLKNISNPSRNQLFLLSKARHHPVGHDNMARLEKKGISPFNPSCPPSELIAELDGLFILLPQVA
jgi:hypothetical protein